MSEIKMTIDFVFSIALFLNAILFIPQAIKIYVSRNSVGISLITFFGFLFIQFTTILYGIITNDIILIYGYSFAFFTTSLVVLLAFKYKKNDNNIFSFSSMIESLPGNVYWKDKNYNFICGNKNNYRAFGLKSLDEFLGKNDYDIFKKEEADKIREVDKKVINKGATIVTEEWVTKSNGKKALYLSHKSPLKNEKNEIVGLCGVSIDITSSKRKTLNDFAMLEKIISIMPGNVYWMGVDERYLGCNENQARLIGLKSRNEIIGKKNIDLKGFLIPEVLDKYNRSVLETGKQVTIEEPALLPDGTEAIYLSNKVALKNESNEIIGMVGVSVDITDRKNAEILKNQLKASELVSGSLAHELRTPFMSIQNHVNIIKNNITNLLVIQLSYICSTIQSANSLSQVEVHLKLIKGQIESLDTILTEVKKSNQLIRIMLGNTKFYGTPDITILSIKDCIIEAIERFPYKLQKQKKLIKFNSSQDFQFLGDKTIMVHIFFNLIKNALNAIEIADKGYIKINLSEIDNNYIINFTDTGIGISEDIQNKIFDQFFTTSSVGSGIGLSFCKFYIELFNGTIKCTSVKGKYTEFKISLPKLS